MESSIKSKTGNAKIRKVGHTTQNKFGQGVSVQERGTKSGSGSDLSYNG